MTTYQELRHEADTRWESRQVDKPWIRVGTAMCGNAAGAQQVISSLKSSIESMNLDVNLDEVGCLGLCYAETNLPTEETTTCSCARLQSSYEHPEWPEYS